MNSKIESASKSMRLLVNTANTFDRNSQLFERFEESIRSPVTPDSWMDYLHAYMRHWLLLDEDGQYRYNWLLNGNVQDRIIHFIIYKKKRGLGAFGLDNYVNSLRQFWVCG